MKILIDIQKDNGFEMIKESNLKMKMERTFWPVGHGAFCTERFLKNNEYSYVAVYDCGTLDGKRLLEKRIEECFVDCNRIDALFISHFHRHWYLTPLRQM